MRKINHLVILLTALLLGIPQMQAAGRESADEPIITVHCDAYKVIGEANNFGLMLGSTESDYFDIDCGFGLEEIEVGPWSVSDGSIVGTYKSVRVSEEGLIRIYGNPAKIDLIQIQGGYVTSIDMEQCVNLEVLDLSHNTLQKLDLTPFTNLYAIYLTDNPFTKETPLKIGAPKNRLAILEIDIIDHLDQSFNLSDYPAMQAFDAYHNRDLWNIDPTGCPELLTMSLELTNVSSVDVTKNPRLRSLNISETRVAQIDLSHNPLLTTLMAEHASGYINTGYHLEGIDLSALTNLNILYLGGNRLKEVDLSKNTALTNLNLSYNNLSKLDVSNNKQLYSVTVSYNDMDFVTLPAPSDNWGEYFYLQNNMPVAKSIGVGQPLDLSSRVIRPGSETTAAVWVKSFNGNDTMLDEALYTYNNGVVTFNQAISDSVYVKYANSLFYEYKLSTTPFMVKTPDELGKPSPIATITPEEMKGEAFSAFVGIAGATPEQPKKFYVDFGNGVLEEFLSTSSSFPEKANINKQVEDYRAITIYMEEGESMTALGIVDLPLLTVNLQKAVSLRSLKINNTGLSWIDLSYNRCLTSINLDNNNLPNLNLAGPYPAWEKHLLRELSAANNKIGAVTIISTTPITSINLSGNRIEEFSLKNFDNIKTLDLSGNLLADELNLAYLSNAESINLSGNALKRVVYDSFADLKNFDISGNKFTIETLPYQAGADNYVYAPQQPVELLKNAPAVNLSDQNRIIVDGVGTTFTWKKADGSLLVDGVDYTCNDGATKFLDLNLGKVYCEMSNPAFPQFAGENILRTTEVNVVGAPTKVVASFTTLEDSQNGEFIIASKEGSALYVDWRGDGSEYISYPAPVNIATYEGIRTYKNAEVKVYTYDTPEEITIFSTDNLTMNDFDGTPMTGLFALSVCGSGLNDGALKLPEANLTELKLNDNNLTEFPWAKQYPGLICLNLAGNKITTFDAGAIPSLQMLYLGRNSLTDIKFNNSGLWDLDLTYNEFEKIDFTGLKDADQLWLAGNKLSEIDLSAYKATLHSLSVNQNQFTFATLPVPDDYPNLSSYYYGNQAKIEAKVSDSGMTFDLSSQAIVHDTYPTTYTWFLGEPVYDSSTGELSGEQLIVDDEYTIANGVTTFNYKFSDDVVCVMTNSLFPKTYLSTPKYRVGYTSDVDVIEVADDKAVDVYTLSGMIVKRGVKSSEALSGLNPGIYIVGGKKVFIK